VYTSIGGLQAVVWTDVLQTFILLSAALCVIGLIIVKMGGVRPCVPTEWLPNWDHQPIFSLDPFIRVTVVGMLIVDFTWWICTAGSDQMAIQRYLATHDVRAARRTFLVSMITGAATNILLVVLGFALLAYFTAYPDSLPASMTLGKNGDQIFPYFIITMLPVGITGLVLSGLIAASMSSLSSGVSSVGTVVMEDFIGRFFNHKTDSKAGIRKAQCVSFAIGILTVLLSMVMAKVPGNILEVTNKTNGLFVAPLFGLFFMALFVPFATSFATFWGAIYGFCAATLVAYWDVLTGQSPLSWQWIVPVSLLVNIVVGVLLSLCSLKVSKTSHFLLYHAIALLVLITMVMWILP
jgi:SSS family solute:Na+ symporter